MLGPEFFYRPSGQFSSGELPDLILLPVLTSVRGKVIFLGHKKVYIDILNYSACPHLLETFKHFHLNFLTRHFEDSWFESSKQTVE